MIKIYISDLLGKHKMKQSDLLKILYTKRDQVNINNGFTVLPPKLIGDQGKYDLYVEKLEEVKERENKFIEGGKA